MVVAKGRGPWRFRILGFGFLKFGFWMFDFCESWILDFGSWIFVDRGFWILIPSTTKGLESLVLSMFL